MSERILVRQDRGEATSGGSRIPPADRRVPADLADTLLALAADPTRAAELPAEAIPWLLGILRAAELAILARGLLEQRPAQPAPRSSPAADSWLTADEVAARLKRTRAWVYRQARRWPFAKRPSRKTLLISERGLARWMEQR